MIQRIQSVYLLITSLLTGNLFFSSMGKIANEEGMFELKFLGLTRITESQPSEVVFSTWPLMLLIALTTLVSLVSIFLYKNRFTQIRICGLNIVLLAGLTGLSLYTLHSLASSIEGSLSYTFAIFLPLIGIVLTILAIRAIGRDEALIRSVDRLR